MTVQPASQPPPDQDQRDLIVSALDRNVVVEAAAGTGKTTSMVDRMVALLRTGACDDIRRMAAVTFTRKAASELRDRFRLALEKAVRGAAGDERGRLAGALDSIDQCFVGTIHSFCGRLLRERPIEAGVDLAFEELDEDADMRLRQEAWAAYAESVIGLGPGSVIDELDDLNLDLSDLADTFYRFAEYPDVDDWPLPPESEMLEDLDEAAVAVKRFTERMRKLADRLPRECGSDRLMPRYSKMPRVVSHYEDLSERASMLELIDMFFDKRSGAVLKEWVQKGGFTQEEARSEREAWDAFREEFAAPLAEAWRELRYRTVMKVITEAGAVYDRMRAERGQLDFQDLLMKAAGLLKGSPHVRSYFAGRYSHLLVDEFQDTDPIQAEVMLLLTATDPRQDDWRLCVPRGGSLFVVGDPKQSIYRFRRADIVTYNRVKRMILEGDGGKGRGIEVRLFANFRTSAAVIQWIDEVFAPKGDCTDKSGRLVCFPEAASEQSPAYVRLEAGRSESLQGELGGVFQLTIPSDEILLTSHLVEGGPPTAQEAAVLARRYTRSELAASYEADLIARYIRWAIDDRVTVPRSEKELEDIHRRMPSCEDPAALRAEDFLIITRNKTHLSTYGQALQRYGIPHRVTGGTALNEVEELRLLLTCLRAVDRVDDPVALVGALRSELFGISDAALYRFRRNGGRFNYNGPVPEGLPPGDEEAITDAFDRLRRYRGWVKTMPPLAAFEKVVSDLGLMVLAATRDGGDVQAGSLGKALELLRGDQRAHWSTSHLVDFLADLVEGEFSYDGVSARSHEVGAVRVMNLHKAKGLESTVVFLADGSGEPRSGPEIVIDRGGDRTIGYIGVFGPRWGAWYRPLLAAPGGWADRQAVEKEFEAAERLRLRYVAATRAGSAMIVCEREDGRANGSNPWKYFRDHLAGVPDLPDPGPRSAPSREALDISVEDVTKASEEAAGRMRRAEGPTYARLAAKEYALRGKDFAKGSGTFAPSTTGGPEYGINWGTAMHMLLELAMSRPGFDVEAWAERVLGENEIDPGETPRAVETVRAVTGSALWERALASDLCLTEVPFHMLLGDADIPTTMNGAMDLAFREEGGWVIVDYKTDRISASRSERALADEYAPQLELYGRAWAGCTGETVKETGLFFVDNRTYHRIR